MRIWVAIMAVVALCVSCSEPTPTSEVRGSGSAPAPAAAHGSAAPGGELHFQPPNGWRSETPSSSMRKGQYKLPRAEGDTEDAELVVYYFGQGQGGSVDANVERWIGQFRKADGAPAGDVARRTTVEVRGIKITIVDVSGTYTGGGPMMGSGEPKPNYRMLAAVAETPGGPWFVKLTGPARTVAGWEKGFQEFLDSMRYQ